MKIFEDLEGSDFSHVEIRIFVQENRRTSSPTAKVVTAAFKALLNTTPIRWMPWIRNMRPMSPERKLSPRRFFFPRKPSPPRLTNMRSLLSVPASQPKMVEKALTLDCDQIILDLEDSVRPADKDVARAYLKDFLSKVESKKRISLRVNELASSFARADIDLICEFDSQPLSSIILPKIHNLDDVKSWARKLPADIQLEVQIESSMGLTEAPQIASHPQVISLAFGPADFMASTGMPSSNPGTPWPEAANVLQWPLMQVVIAAHAYGKTAYDGPYFQITDHAGLLSSARTARALGVDGKWVIHPNQIALVNEAFTPSPVEIAHAQEIIAAFNASSGATNLDGLMIDEASKKVAERLLERVTQIRK